MFPIARGTLRFEGIADLSKGLKRRADLKDVKNVVRLNGSELQRSAQRRAPVDTGNLRRSIGYSSQDDGLTAKVASEAGYSGYVNKGTRFMYARPFMTNSFMEQRQKFLNDMKRLMR